MESVTFVTKVGDRQFLLSGIPDISEFVNRANEILSAALSSGIQTLFKQIRQMIFQPKSKNLLICVMPESCQMTNSKQKKVDLS